MLYTSGTTAQPKGVVHSGCALVHEAFSMQREWGLTYRETMVMASPLPHITGILQGLLVPCLAGARVLLTDRWDPEACVELIEREGGTYMAGATPFLRGVLDAYAARGPGRPQLRQFCCGGAPVSPALIEEAQRAGIVAHRSWGLTELPSATFSRTIDPLRQRAETDGRPGEGIEVEAVDDERAPLPRGAEGELRIRGPERMEGYVDAALNAGAMDDDGWVYTGDVGLVDRDGCVRVTGRLKDIVNRGGEKLSAREIEELLERHDSIREAAVVPVPDERLGETVGAAVVLRPGDGARPTRHSSVSSRAGVGEPEAPRQGSGRERAAQDALGKAAEALGPPPARRGGDPENWRATVTEIRTLKIRGEEGPQLRVELLLGPCPTPVGVRGDGPQKVGPPGRGSSSSFYP